MNRFIQISTILILFLFVSGCLLPIPHKRTCRAGYEGIVTDALTGVPITNATVTIEYLGGTNIITQTDSLSSSILIDYPPVPAQQVLG